MEQHSRSGESGAVINALSILEALASGESGASLSSLARLLFAPKTSVSRILFTLENHGYVERNAESKLYTLGHRLRITALRPVDPKALVAAAKETLDATAKLTGETAHLAILEKSEVTYLDVSTGTHRILASVEPGERARAHSVASGLAILSVSPSSLVEEVIRHGLTAVTERTIVTADRLYEVLQFARAQGYATVRGEWSMDVAAVAVPIFGKNKQVLGAIGVSGPAARFVDSKVLELSDVLKRHSLDIGARLNNLSDD